METYSFLRGLADSWFLILMVAFFVGVVLFTFRPGSRKTHEDVSRIPFRHEDRPAPSDEAGDGDKTGNGADSAAGGPDEHGERDGRQAGN